MLARALLALSLLSATGALAAPLVSAFGHKRRGRNRRRICRTAEDDAGARSKRDAIDRNGRDCPLSRSSSSSGAR